MELRELTLAMVLERLTEWRNFPKYQLERHVDVFLSFFMREVLERKFSRAISATIIPELPIPIRDDGEHNRSWNVDFVLFSRDLEIAYLVELKTDETSVKQKQDERLAGLLQRQNTGVRVFDAVILPGIQRIAKATKHRWKYLCLLRALEEAGVTEGLPAELRAATSSAGLRGLNGHFAAGVKLKKHPEVGVVYIVPNEQVAGRVTLDGATKITFSEFVRLCGAKETSPLREHLHRWERSPGC